ncbi:MAG: hypothetical protein AABX05_03715 [Nanoarchaeota archaeon]
MKITIDTQVDTHEDIRKVLQVLNSILNNKEATPSSSDTTNLMGMFSDEPQKGTVETTGTAPDFSSFLNLAAQKNERKDDRPRIEPY